MQALEDKKVKAQQALARKQKRNAAMQAMLAKPGYQGALLESVVEIDKEDPGWVLDGAIRCGSSSFSHIRNVIWPVLTPARSPQPYLEQHHRRAELDWIAIPGTPLHACGIIESACTMSPVAIQWGFERSS